jgi:hypothetical protein
MRRSGGSARSRKVNAGPGRWVARCVACWVTGVVGVAAGLVLAGSGGVALGAASTGGAGGSQQGLVLSSPVVPSVQPLEEAQQAANARQEQWESPAAREARLLSRTKFEHLGLARAAQVAREAFPAVIDRPAGGPPQLPAGGRIADYASANAAQLDLPGGKHAVVESMEPMAVGTSSGQLAPVDLGLTQAGGMFESVRPVVGVLIPRRLGDGVQLPEGGVSLTPVDSRGSSLGGAEGAVDGSGVLYANTQTDADTVIRPTTLGFDASTVLRSVNSPQQLFFRVGLPPGASLVQAGGDRGSVSVVENGRSVALIRPPSATDAAGTPVPVSMSVKGDLLALAVSASGGEYQWPIMVDPEVIWDSKIGPSQCSKEGETERESSNWCFATRPGTSNFTSEWKSKSVAFWNNTTIGTGEYADVQYLTQGESKIYEIEAATHSIVAAHGEAKLQLTHNVTHSGGPEEGEPESTEELAKETNVEKVSELCAKLGEKPCSSANGVNGNIAWYRIEALKPAESPGVDGELESANVWISQEKAPVVSFNTSESEIDEIAGKKRTNVLAGAAAGSACPRGHSKSKPTILGSVSAGRRFQSDRHGVRRSRSTTTAKASVLVSNAKRTTPRRSRTTRRCRTAKIRSTGKPKIWRAAGARKNWV